MSYSGISKIFLLLWGEGGGGGDAVDASGAAMT